MANFENYKSKFTKESLSVFQNFERTGEDDMFFLGQIAKGEAKGVTLSSIIQRAQVFANPDFIGRIGSAKSFFSLQIPVVKGALDGSIKGLINNGFTSHIVADKKIGLSDLRETYSSSIHEPFYKNVISVDLSAIESKLNRIASNSTITTKKYWFSKEKEEPFQITFKRSQNSLCDLMDEIYQVVDKRIGDDFETKLEKATASIFATFLISRAIDLSIEDDKKCEKKLDEAMKLQFYTHLNGCSNNGNCAISKIISKGAECAEQIVDELGYKKEDILNKLERLDNKVCTHNIDSIKDAWFGSKMITIENVDDLDEVANDVNFVFQPASTEESYDEKDIVDYVDNEASDASPVAAQAAIASAPSVINNHHDEEVTSEDEENVKVDEKTKVVNFIIDPILNEEINGEEALETERDEKYASSVAAQAAIASAPPVLLIGDGKTEVVLNPGEKVAGVDEKIAKVGEEIAGVDEKVVDKDARVAESGEVVHNKGNAVNYNTLKRNMLKSIAEDIDSKASQLVNRAEKHQDLNALTESNFWSGARDGILGLSMQRGKTPAYCAGHKQGQNFNRGLIQEIDKIYSPDKKKLIVEVKGKGAAVTKKLADRVVNAFGFDAFVDFAAMVMSSLSQAFSIFKTKPSKVSDEKISKS